MEIKKRIKAINFLQLFLDLLIVFIGVTLAFIFTNYQQNKLLKEDTQQMISLLEVGLVQYEQLFGGFVQYHENYNEQFRESLDSGVIPDYSDVTYPAPQYPIDVIRYILTNESYELVDPEFYVKLTQFSTALQQLMYTEEKLVQTAEKFEELSWQNGSQEKLRESQFEIAARYLRYLEIRKNRSLELRDQAIELIKLISL